MRWFACQKILSIVFKQRGYNCDADRRGWLCLQSCHPSEQPCAQANLYQATYEFCWHYNSHWYIHTEALLKQEIQQLNARIRYLWHKPLPGAHLRYFVFSGSRLRAILGFGASAWSVAGRNRYIGWTAKQRRSNLHLIVNNARFLILPWIRSRNLASKILSLACKQMSPWPKKAAMDTG